MNVQISHAAREDDVTVPGCGERRRGLVPRADVESGLGDVLDEMDKRVSAIGSANRFIMEELSYARLLHPCFPILAPPRMVKVQSQDIYNKQLQTATKALRRTEFSLG